VIAPVLGGHTAGTVADGPNTVKEVYVTDEDGTQRLITQDQIGEARAVSQVTKTIFVETSVNDDVTTARVTTVTTVDGKETTEEVEFSGTQEEVNRRIESLKAQ